MWSGRVDIIHNKSRLILLHRRRRAVELQAREGERGGGGGRSWRGRRSSSGVRVKNRTCTTRGHRHISINEFSGYRGLFPARRAADPELHSQLQSAPARIPPFWESGRNLYVNPESQHRIFGEFLETRVFLSLPPSPSLLLPPRREWKIKNGGFFTTRDYAVSSSSVIISFFPFFRYVIHVVVIWTKISMERYMYIVFSIICNNLDSSL